MTILTIPIDRSPLLSNVALPNLNNEILLYLIQRNISSASTPSSSPITSGSARTSSFFTLARNARTCRPTRSCSTP